MATGVTRIADVVVPAIFNPYVQQETMRRSSIVQSGAVDLDSGLAVLLSGGGLTFNRPSWKDLDDDAENVSSDDPAVLAVPNKIGTSTEIQVRLSRNNSWSAMDLDEALAGADPMTAIGNRVANYWALRFQAAFLATVAGVYAENATALPANATQNDQTFNVSGGGFVDGTTNFTAGAFLDAEQTMGDASGDLGLVIVHSVVKTRMEKENLIDYLPDSEGRPIASYRGKTLIVNDGMPNSGGIFQTFIFGRGAFKVGNGTAKVPTETDRVPLAGNGGGQEILVNRVEWLIHPVGHAYTGVAPMGGPTNAATTNNLAHADSWERRWAERKMIKMARLITREF